MLYYLHYFDTGQEEWYNFLRLFSYSTFRAAGACLMAFLISVIFGERVILKLISLKAGQPIRTASEVHKLAELHGGKVGTPTMGGGLIVFSVVASVLLWAKPTNPFIHATLFVALGTALLGLTDDYKKIEKKNSKGVSARFKLIVQFVVAFAAVAYLFAIDHPEYGWQNALVAKNGELHSISEHMQRLWIPFMKSPLEGGWWLVVLLPFVVVGCSNAVNLTDGLDGLATGCTLTTVGAYAGLTYAIGNSIVSNYLYLPFHPLEGEMVIFCSALLGACLGFLWFNCHPAKVFMGDTGSLSIGGMLGMIAICCKQELLLIIIGGVFVLEAGSVIVQVTSFKLTGKRVFKMSPLHHYFELMGWPESRVINRFWIASIVFALIGIATLKIR